MTYFIHKQLINRYKLSPLELPEKLSHAVAAFDAIERKDLTDEVILLLKKLDENLSIGIYEWMVQNKAQLSCIVKQDAEIFEIFFMQLQSLIKEGKREDFDYITDGRKYELNYFGKTEKISCVYYHLEEYSLKVCEVCDRYFLLKLCEEERTLEPLYYKDVTGKILQVYDYYQEKAKVNVTARVSINSIFEETIKTIEAAGMTFTKVPPIHSAVRKLKISLNNN
ncbi:MAG TPA: hypothetical protein VF691_11105 [Cytophagaceae bacterium]